MNSTFTLLDLDLSLENARNREIDLSLCILCQKDSGEDLVSPSQNKRAKKDTGYGTLERNLPEFQRLRKVPFESRFESLNTGLGIKKNLEKNIAVYHKTCFLKFSDSKLKKARLSDIENIPPHTASPVPTRQSSGLSFNDENQRVCVLCTAKGSERLPLQRINMEKGGMVMKDTAAKKSDTKVLVLLQGKDVWCHKKCRSSYIYNKVEYGNSNHLAEANKASFAEVVKYINELKENTTDSPVLSMAQITRLYSIKMQEYGIETSGHSSRLKDQLLRECPYLESSGTAGQNHLIRFKKDVDIIIRNECSTNKDNGVLGQAAREIRKEMFAHETKEWDSMSSEAAAASVPFSLTNLVSLIVDGEPMHEGKPDKVVSNIAQLLYFHARKGKAGEFRRHNAARETPALVYLPMKLFGETRSKSLVDTVHELGYGISYDRLATILKTKAVKACAQYKEDGLVCPIHLELGAFTTAAVDNIDHDTTSMTCKTSFHGTAISLSEHGPRGEPRQLVTMGQGIRSMGLPDDYVVVTPSFLDNKMAVCPSSSISRVQLQSDTEPLMQERDLLERCREESTTDTWPAHHSKNVSAGVHLTRHAVLPVFREKSQSLSMMAHSMDISMKAIGLLNPSQIPVLVADQPLYALCKQIQWLQPDKFGEDKMYVMLGAMHIEMAAMRALGHWLEGSGWTSTLVEAEMTTSGRAEGLVTVNHLTRARYAHQVTAAVLYSLKRKAYDEQCSDDPLSYEQWCEEKRSTCPQFRFWDIALTMELIVLQIVRALRTGDFCLFNAALARFALFFFALDHHNYARWIPVHIRDNITLETRHPSLWTQFMYGNFVADKSDLLFSKIALDQAHEQMNALLKGNGGMIGLTEDPAALLKWMLYAPEVADITNKYESSNLKPKPDHSGLHHFDSNSAESLFLKDKQSLETIIEHAGNPFAEDDKELYNIDTRKCCGEDVIKTVMKMEDLGMEQYTKFTEERLEQTLVPIHGKLKKNSLPTFAKASKSSKPTKSREQIKSLKNDVTLFSRMWVALSNNRPGDLDEFFSHENQEFPPALATLQGFLRTSSKEDLMNRCLAPLLSSCLDRMPVVDAKIMDGPALAHILRPGLCVLFSDYRDKVFLPFVSKEAESVSRVDIVWDRYRDKSLKEMTREKRGEGPRIRVEADTKIARDWRAFLRNSQNKDELFQLLAASISIFDANGVELYATKGETVINNCGRIDLNSVAPCNHEEADTRIFVHVTDAVHRGAKKVLVRASDTDVIALACSAVPQLPDLEELWVHRPTSKNNKFIAVHEICNALGPAKSLAIPALHAFTGCDTVDAFYGIGKKTAWHALFLQPQCVEALMDLADGKVDLANLQLQKLVIAMYSPGKSYGSINQCRRGLFSASNRPLESIPPTEDALRLHCLRASLQAQIWRQQFLPIQTTASPSNWGWKEENEAWIPIWRTKAKSSESSKLLIKCNCKVACKGNCSCKNIGCCDLCKCPCNADAD